MKEPNKHLLWWLLGKGNHVAHLVPGLGIGFGSGVDNALTSALIYITFQRIMAVSLCYILQGRSIVWEYNLEERCSP